MREHHSGGTGVDAVDLVNGSVAKTLFLFSFPFMLSTLLQTAYSTTDTIIVGQFVSVVFSFVFLLKHADAYGIKFGRNSLRVDSATARQLTIIGLPFAVQMTAVQVSFLFVGRMINALGVTVSAAFGVMQKVRSIPGFITQGFGLGSASMIGQNLGARKIERVNSVVKYCILFTVIIDVIFGSLYLLVPMFWFRIFTQDADVLSYAAMVMLALAIEIPANCFMPACNSLVSAQGFVQLSFTVAMLDAFAGRIFFCWLFGNFFHMQAFGYFLGYVLGTYVTSIIVLYYYASGWWKKRATLV